MENTQNILGFFNNGEILTSGRQTKQHPENNVLSFDMGNVDANDFIAGWVGGASSVLTSHALDTIKFEVLPVLNNEYDINFNVAFVGISEDEKRFMPRGAFFLEIVRLQTGNSGQTALDCVMKTLRHEGVRGLYKGMSFPLLTASLYNSFVFGIYNNMNNAQQSRKLGHSNADPTYLQMTLSAMVAGAMSTAIGSPVDLIKIRLQAQYQKTTTPNGIINITNIKLLDKAQFPQASIRSFTTAKRSKMNMHTTMLHNRSNAAKAMPYSGPVHCIREIVRMDGICGLYNGCTTMIIRDIPGYVIYFIPYSYLRQKFRRKNERETRPLGLILAGGISGMLSWGIMHPIDTLKSRIQADSHRYSGFADCLRKTLQEDGAKVLFRGLAVNALRGFPQSAFLFFGYEMTMRMLI